MNKSESKYYNTALLMNQALIELLNKKDFEFITIKEICKKAGVNRSTFYLHYETLTDLLEESLNNIDKQFFSYFEENSSDFLEEINKIEKEKLIFITPKYLAPYLNFIKENKTIHKVAVKHTKTMNSYERFNQLNKHIFLPIFKKFGIDEKTEYYMISYYINGITAIINEWVKDDCKDDIEYIENIIINCIRPVQEKSNEQK